MDLPNQIPGTSVGGFGEALKQEDEKRYTFFMVKTYTFLG